MKCLSQIYPNWYPYYPTCKTIKTSPCHVLSSIKILNILHYSIILVGKLINDCKYFSSSGSWNTYEKKWMNDPRTESLCRNLHQIYRIQIEATWDFNSIIYKYMIMIYIYMGFVIFLNNKSLNNITWYVKV